MRTIIRLCLPAAALVMLSGADIYRWVDEGGVVNYTQMKPSGIRVDQITTRTGSPTIVREATEFPEMPGQDPGQDGNANLNEDQQAMLRDLQAAEDQRQREISRIRQANCDRSRDILAQLSTRERIRVRDKSGGPERVMAEDERQNRIQEAQQRIVENCDS